MSITDLSGKIVFKVKLDKEIKKIVIHNDDINYNELLLMMQRIFSEKIKPTDDILMKYTDEENDLITLSNDSDVLLALQSSKILKLTLFLKNEQSDREASNNTEEILNPNEIVKELYNIRMGIDKFLEKFERVFLKISDIKLEDSLKLTSNNQTIKSNDLHKEFDPILASKKDNLNLAQNHIRSQTPETSSLDRSVTDSPSQPKFNSFNQQQQHQNGATAPHYAQQQSFQQHPPQMTNQDQVSAPPQPQQHQQQHFQGFNQAPQQQHLNQPANPQQYTPNQFQMNPNSAALKGPPQPQQQFQGFQNPTDPQAHQAFYNQQQQQQQPGGMPGVMPQSFHQTSGPNALSNAGNPYSKAPNQSLARPPSTTIYQQGYK